MELIDFLLIALIFGEFFLFLAVASYLEKRKEKGAKTKSKDFFFFEAVWTKSKIIYAVYPDHLEIFVPTSRVEIQEKRRHSD